MSKKVQEIWWEGNDLYIKTEDDTMCFKNAYIKDIKYDFESDIVKEEQLKINFETLLETKYTC